MKIGFSLGRCIRDIVRGQVAFDDVLVIVTRTRATTLDTVIEVVDEYMYEPTYLKGLDQAKCRQIATDLWNQGKIHQPRLNGTFPPMLSNDYVWMDIVPTATDMNETVQSAWQQYRTALGLINRIPSDPGQSLAKQGVLE